MISSSRAVLAAVAPSSQVAAPVWKSTSELGSRGPSCSYERWATGHDPVDFVGCGDYKRHPTDFLGQVKSADGRCFGVDGWVKPVMTSCDSDTTPGETGLPVENSWYLIEHDRRN